MSSRNDRPSRGARTWGLVVATLLNLAMGVPGAGAAEDSTVDLKDAQGTDAPARKSTRLADGRLRCWQQGRLVFEGRGLSPAARSGSAVLALQTAVASEPHVQLLDLKQGLCILEHPSR